MKRVHAPSDLDVIGDAEAGPLPDNAMSLNGYGYDLLRIVDPGITFAYGVVYYQSMQDLFPRVDLGPYSSVQVTRIHARGTSVPYVNFLDFACLAPASDFNALDGLRKYFVPDASMSRNAESTLAFVNADCVQTGSIRTPHYTYKDVVIRCDMNGDEEVWGLYGRIGNVVHYTLTFAMYSKVVNAMYWFLVDKQSQDRRERMQSASTLLCMAHSSA
tara:strand:+ start:541 stop:1188 length:648 start_codon:yes stop_codon:yes gene_type:complete